MDPGFVCLFVFKSEISFTELSLSDFIIFVEYCKVNITGFVSPFSGSTSWFVCRSLWYY